MNVIKFVPGNATARARDRRAIYKVTVGQNRQKHHREKRGKAMPDVVRLIALKGWIRMSDLKPAERRLYHPR